MLAQWLVRMNPAEWRKDETPAGKRLAVIYLLGSGLALIVALMAALLIGPGEPFAWFTAGWILWSGLVAAGVWRVVRRLDVSSPPPRHPAFAGGQAADGDDDEIVFHHALGSGALIPYRRNPDAQRRAMIHHIENDILIPETPEWGFPRAPGETGQPHRDD